MNRTLTQLNAIKNPNSFIKVKPKPTVFLLFCLYLILSLNTAWAQTVDCAESDPLQWDWVQDLIDQGIQGSGCGINSIRQFQYNGSTFIKTTPGWQVNASYIQDIPSYYYNCEGNVVCETDAFAVILPERLCDADINAAANNAATIWTYDNNPSTETCPEGDPLQWDWIQDIITSSDGLGIASIRQFEYEGNTYFNTVNAKIFTEVYSLYYNCEGAQICENVFGYSDDQCEEEIISASYNATTIIWTFADTAPAVFQEYPWLNSRVNQSNCNGESITVYDTGYYNFILIQNGNEGKLYFEDGTYYCDETPTYSCVAAYGLTNVTQTWSCSNNTSVSGCTDGNAINYNSNANVDDGSCQYENAPVFSTYPWLSTYVNQNNCAGESITIYDAGYYNFILIQNGNEGKLYLDNGTYYCDETPTYSCVAAYGLTNVAQTWSCSNNTSVSGCTDANAINYNSNATLDDGSCEYDNNNAPVFSTFPWLSTYVNEGNCNGESITVYDTGYYNFILIQNGNEGKLYFENGTYYCDETPTYSCVAAYSLTNVAQTWSCSNTSISGCTDTNAINYNVTATADDGSCAYEDEPTNVFSTYTWLSALVDANNCGDESITVYDTGYYNFIFVKTPTSSSLYFQDGTFYCSDAPGYSCVTNYNLSNVVDSWSCGDTNPTPRDCNVENPITDLDWLADMLYTYLNPPNSVRVSTYLYNENLIYQVDLADFDGDITYYYCNGERICALNPFNQTNTCTDFQATFVEEIYNSATANATIEFNKYPWLTVSLNLIGCIWEPQVLEYEFGNDTYVYFKTIRGGKLYLDDGTLTCEDADGQTCLNTYNLSSPTSTWTCAEGSFQKYDYVYTICAGESVDLIPNGTELIFIPCVCPPCGVVGPPSYPPEVDWMPLSCDNCTQFTVSPTSDSIYSATAQPYYYGDSGCSNVPGGWPPILGPRADPVTTTFLVKVEQCPPAKTATFERQETAPSFNIYPNPSSNKVFIDLPNEAMYQINLMDISGKMMKQIETELNPTTVEINVSDLPKGMYFLELRNEVSSSIQKLIIE